MNLTPDLSLITEEFSGIYQFINIKLIETLYSENLDAPDSLDYSNGTCKSTIRNQICNSCSAHATTSTLEYCLCLAGAENVAARLVEET